MPLTFIDIEKQKNWRIGLLFIFLILLYLLISVGLLFSFYQTLFLESLFGKTFPLSAGWLFILFFFSCAFASVHFYLSAYDTVRYIRKNINATEPDPEDSIHKQLMNIMEEIHVVTGNSVRMQCVVIPSLALNALSAIDMRGNALVAITEGLLSRLSRDQIEAVIAHEAHHILSGDCLESTVAASLFGVPASIVEKVQMFSEGRAYISPAFILTIVLLKLSQFLNMFISREREYRADAGAVRMTRNPLALAEVLHILWRNWRGSGFIGSGLENLCIVNPKVSAFDESEGWIANLLSTHPPIRKRISFLLNMVRVRLSDLETRNDTVSVPTPSDQNGDRYFALDHRYQWQGPYTLAELALLPWFAALTWISTGGISMQKASDIPVLNNIFMKRIAQEGAAQTSHPCPVCHHPLLKRSVEKTRVMQCKFCGGTLVDHNRVFRIIVRGADGYSERIRTLSKITLKKNQVKKITRSVKGSERNIPLLSCPLCKNKMTRAFYSLVYLIELDRCSWCRVTWFDRDELKMLQCMIHTRMASERLR